MIDLRDKIIYGFAILAFLVLGICFGYTKTKLGSDITIENNSLIDYDLSYAFSPNEEATITVSTKTYDIKVIYEDNYTVCGENVTTTKTVYGTTMDQVKIDEKKYQEKNGLLYTIKAESDETIIYTRTIDENCPNHFLVILENSNINVYSIQSETNKTAYMTIENINVENLRDEIRIKVEKGTYINSKDELNKFIEDLES